MKSGSTYLLIIHADVGDISKVDKAIFTLQGAETLKREYPTDVSYDNKMFVIALTQEDTIALATEKGKKVEVEGQVNFTDKSVMKTEKSSFFIGSTLATEIVEGNRPGEYQIADIHLDFIDGVLIAHVNPEEVNAAVKRLDDAVADMYAKAESGEFKGDKGDKGDRGDKGDKGDTYTITEADYNAIAGDVVQRVDFSAKVVNAEAQIEARAEEVIATIPQSLHVENGHLTFTI